MTANYSKNFPLEGTFWALFLSNRVKGNPNWGAISLKNVKKTDGASGTKIDVKLLIREAQAGNIQAFEELVLLYQEKVYTLSYYLAGNHADAQDLAQEVFLRAYTNLRKFRHESDLGTWLHRIAVNLWINWQRQKKKNTGVVSLDDPIKTDEGEITRAVAVTNPEADPVEVLENKELQELIREALEDLPEDFRMVLVLREIEGYSYDEIAKIAGCSLGTTKSRLSRARQALKEIIKKKGIKLQPDRNQSG